MKGLLVLSHDVEDVEALATRALLRRAGLDVVTVTFESTLDIRTSFGLTVKADRFAFDVHLDDYDFVIIPGGRYVAQVIDKDQHIQPLVRLFHEQQKLVAAICAGPRFLGRAGLLDGKSFTAFPGSEKDMPKGHYQPDRKTLTDGNIITARGAGVVYDFVYEIVQYLLGTDKADALLAEIRH